MEDRPYLYKEDERADVMRKNLKKRKEQARAREEQTKEGMKDNGKRD